MNNRPTKSIIKKINTSKKISKSLTKSNLHPKKKNEK